MKIIIPHLTMVGKFYLYGLVVQICFLNLLSAAPSNGQNNMDLQKVYLDLNLNQYPLVSTFDEIEKRTDFNFFYDEILNDHPHLVNLHVTHRNLEEVLLELAASHQLSFKQVGEKISVKWNKNKNARKVLVVEISISGKVTDESGVPIPGATVSVAGTSIGTVTDQDGNYVLEVPEGGTIFFSFIGFKSQNILVQNQQTIDVTLSEDVGSLDEVVVVGYGTQKKENLTGAVDVISNEQIQNRQSPTVSQLLQGQSPGISFSVGNNGFQPGAEMGINIRGIGSLNGGSPFVLIDGIPGEMDRLNPDDIESISVLKDAAASAVYGARAPYGVILITTKSGQNNEKISATYSGSLSVATPQRLPSMVDSYTHALAINEAGVAGNGGRTYTNQVVDRIIAYQDGDIDYLRQFTVPDATHFETVPLSNGFWGQMQQGHANYDWFDEYYGSALNQKHNLSLQGGSQSTSFYFSAGYFGQEGVLNYGTDNFERLNIMAKVKTQIADWWSFTYQPRFMKSTRIMPNPQNGGNYGIIFHQIARTMPMQAKFDGFGNFTLHSKIPWTQDAGINRMETTENWHNFSTVITPLKNWDINADFAYRTTDYFQSDQALTIYEYRVDQSTVPNGNTVPSSIQQYHHSNNYWNSNIFSSYAFTLGDKHNFNWLAGMQLERNNIRQLRVIKNNLLVQDVVSLQTASGEPSAVEDLARWSTQGYFTRLTYNYDEKYLLEMNARRDGTSRFRQNKRWGTFPSISAGWNVHNEPFWQPIENTINSFKLRGSWGTLGNQNVTPYQDINLIPIQTNPLNWIYGYGQGRPIGFTGTPNLVSPDLTWETSTSVNIGIDLSFFENRLQGTFDWFERMTTDMIGPAEAQPGVLGASLPQANNASLRTRGWELSIRWNHNVAPDFDYYINANLFDSRSVVTQYLNPTGTLSTWYEGSEVGEIWGYTAHDLFRTEEEVLAYQADHDLSRIWAGTWRPGDVKFEDTNGDGSVDNGSNTTLDPGDLSIIGNNTSRYNFGISGGINFRGFDFSMLWNGTAKRDLFFNANDNIFWGFRTWNQSTLFPHHLDYFRNQEGDMYTGLAEGEANFNLDAYYPRAYIHNGENRKNRQVSTRYLRNGAFVRLQNVQVGYNLPPNMLQRWNITRFRVYISGENLITITDLPKGIDPIAIQSNWGTGKTYGADRIVSLGLTLSY